MGENARLKTDRKASPPSGKEGKAATIKPRPFEAEVGEPANGSILQSRPFAIESGGTPAAPDGMSVPPRQIGGGASAHSIQRVKTKKIRGVKIRYAENETEALELCTKEAESYELDEWDEGEWEYTTRDVKWDDIPGSAREVILRMAQTPTWNKDPAGLPLAEKMIFTEVAELRKAEGTKERTTRSADDYKELSEDDRIAGNAILSATVDLMHGRYVHGGERNITLGGTHTRQNVRTAVDIWRGRNYALSNDLTLVSNLHGYYVGPKNESVGDTLDRRGDQGNIIATWGNMKINVHINPSD